MLIATHALIGAFVGERLSDQPGLAFLLGAALHFLTDMIPHGDSGLMKGYMSGSKVRRAIAYVVMDACLTIYLILVLFNTRFVEHRFAIAMGIAGGILPDLLASLYHIAGLKAFRPLYRLHFFFHDFISSRKGDISFLSGIAMQCCILAVLFTVL